MDYERLMLSQEEVKRLLKKEYGIVGEPEILPGEVDFNYHILSLKSNYVLKISRPNTPIEHYEYQNEILKFINSKNPSLKIPEIILNKKKSEISKYTDSYGINRIVRLLSWVDGRLYSSVNPQNGSLRNSLGQKSALISKLLKGFNHSFAHREFDWDVAQSLWTIKYLYLFSNEQRKILSFFQKKFQESKESYSKLKKAVIHNDINDNNILVDGNLIKPSVISIIDFGDSIYTQQINELGSVCAYAIMNQNDPLEASLDIVEGYNKVNKLKDIELYHLYNVIAMKTVISVTKSAINKTLEPDNKYLQISEESAWSLLKKWIKVDSEFAYYSYRKACSLDAHPNKNKFDKWAKNNGFLIGDLMPEINKTKFYKLDLSVGSNWLGTRNEIEDLDFFQFKIEKLQKTIPDYIISGGYLEPRSIYSSNSYEKVGNEGEENRTIHLGLDFWVPVGTKVSSIYDGEIVAALNDKGNKEYGGLVVIKHNVEDFEFFTLYGHNSVDSVLKNKVGSKVRRGEIIAEVANYPENGNWAPHLHFQIILSMLNYKIDYPGVCYSKQEDVWKDICPDPNILFKSKELISITSHTNTQIIDYRKKYIGKSLKLHYNIPIRIVRGEGVYLIDHKGNKYLDTVNNVAHVGHENEEVVSAGKSQMSVLNTNSRYLHENINHLTKEILSTFPKELNVVHYVNSGSEANELAIRMMKAHTGNNDIIVSQHGYHGNTNKCVDISSYKFDGKGGSGAPKNTHVIPIPNNFNGKYVGDKKDDKYVDELKTQIKKIKNKKRGLGGFIIEPIISCGGQVELPKGFLKKAYEEVRKNGGICISDEVQVGCGRMGKTFWGFQEHNVIPDIVTIGKPIGNGHPIGVVVCKKEIAESFANGMEFFNTFGGNPVSCSIALEVLKTIKKNNLQKNAKLVGDYFKKELKKLAKDNMIIADVRGQGLFLGIEFLDNNKKPLSEEAKYIINRLKDFGILSSVDGPFNNVIKIKPPMIFSKSNCDLFLKYFKKILREDFVAKY